MNWALIIPVLLFWYWSHQLSKRIERLEENRGSGVSYFFSVNVIGAIHKHPKFLRESKIKSALLGKEYKDWTAKEKDLFGKFLQKNVGDKGWIGITYLASENGFLINYRGKTDFHFRGLGTKNLVSEIILCDKNNRFFGDRFSLELDVRVEKDMDGNYRDFLVCYLEEKFEGWGKESKAQVLFKFPYNSNNLDDDYYKKLGFEVKWEGAEDAGKDALGEIMGIPSRTTFKQNGAEIFICH